MGDAEPTWTISTYRLGTTLLKMIKGVWHEGTVTSYDPDTELYMIVYDNNDSEELEHEILRRHISRRQYKEAAIRRSRIWLAQTNL